MTPEQVATAEWREIAKWLMNSACDWAGHMDSCKCKPCRTWNKIERRLAAEQEADGD